MVKITDKFKVLITTLEQTLKDIEEKESVEIKQVDPEEKFIKIYNSMQKYVHTSEQRKKAEEILKKYNQIQIDKDNEEFPKGQIYKKPLRLDGLFEIMGRHLKINYRITDKFKLLINTLEKTLKEIEEKESVEIKQVDPEEKFIRVYNSMKKYTHTSEQRRKAEEILKKYNKIQIIKDNREYPKGQIYKKPLRLDGLFEIMGKPLKINYK